MPNVLNVEPLREIARRASYKIRDPKLADRFVRIAVDGLLRDPRAYRAATEADLINAPAWARAAFARGEEISIYRRNPALAARINLVARRIENARTIAATPLDLRPESGAVILDALLFLKKFDRMNFSDAARKSLAFSRALQSWGEDDDAKPICDAQTLVLLGGHIWHRITSVADLRRIGAEFRNCLGRTTSKGGYGASLKRGKAQFWVLRDLQGAGLIVAMAPAPSPTHFQEVKGPSNARIRADHPAVLQLGIAIGVRPPPPTPPEPPRPLAASPLSMILPAVLEARRPCRCSLCDPHLRLRRSIAAP